MSVLLFTPPKMLSGRKYAKNLLRTGGSVGIMLELIIDYSSVLHSTSVIFRVFVCSQNGDHA